MSQSNPSNPASSPVIYKYSDRYDSILSPGIIYVILRRTHGLRIKLSEIFTQNGYLKAQNDSDIAFNDLFSRIRERLKREKRKARNVDEEIISITDDGKDKDDAQTDKLMFADMSAAELQEYTRLQDEKLSLLAAKYKPAYLKVFLSRILNYRVEDEDGKTRECKTPEDLLQFGNEELIPEILGFIGQIGLTDEERINLGLPISSVQPEGGKTQSSTAQSAANQETPTTNAESATSSQSTPSG